MGVLVGCQEDSCGTVGEACDRACPEGNIGICVTSSLCSCVQDGMAGAEAGEQAGTSDLAGSEGGMSAGQMGPSECSPPVIGDLALNEVMVDAEGEESRYEFVE